MNEAKAIEAEGYRAFLQRRMRERRPGERGIMSELAKAARVHPTMISHVFNGEAELSPEHALHLAAYLRLDEAETDRLLYMVMLARSGTDESRRFFQRKISRKLPASERSRLFANWLPEATSLLLSISPPSTATSLSRKLGSGEVEVEDALGLLEAHGYCRSERGLYTHKESLLASDDGERQLSEMAWRAFLNERRGRGQNRMLSRTKSILCRREDAERLRGLLERWMAETSMAPSGGTLTVFSLDLVSFAETQLEN